MATTEKTIWEELRKPFPKDTVGLLPKVSCYACAQATKTAKSALDKHCGNHSMSKCGQCGNYITSGHIHLDYVGHAAVTDRLNSVDPTWTWEPAAVDPQGAPALDKEGNLWIKLSVGGVTRLGVGDGSNMKERIGDALRNAAMRFGVALDLWTKDELESQIDAPELKNDKPSLQAPDSSPATATTEPRPAVIPPPTLTSAQIEELFQIAKKKGHTTREGVIEFLNGASLSDDFTKLEASQFTAFKKAVIATGWKSGNDSVSNYGKQAA